jgi:hypothetical protein
MKGRVENLEPNPCLGVKAGKGKKGRHTYLAVTAPLVNSGGLSPLGVFSSPPAFELPSAAPATKPECQLEATVEAPLFLPNVPPRSSSDSTASGSNTLEAAEEIGEVLVDGGEDDWE